VRVRVWELEERKEKKKGCSLNALGGEAAVGAGFLRRQLSDTLRRVDLAG